MTDPVTTPKTVNLTTAIKSTPKAVAAVVEQMTGLQEAGVGLVKTVLFLIAAFVVVWIVCFAIIDYSCNTKLATLEQKIINIPDAELNETKLAHLSKIIQQLKDDRRETRDLWQKVFSLILLNILFPTLTALLGYIFGTSKKK